MKFREVKTIFNGNCMYDAVRRSLLHVHGHDFPASWNDPSSLEFRRRFAHELCDRHTRNLSKLSKRNLFERMNAPHHEWSHPAYFAHNDEILVLSSVLNLCIHVYKDGFLRFAVYHTGHECVSHTEEYRALRRKANNTLDVWIYEQDGMHFTALIPVPK